MQNNNKQPMVFGRYLRRNLGNKILKAGICNFLANNISKFMWISEDGGNADPVNIINATVDVINFQWFRWERGKNPRVFNG